MELAPHEKCCYGGPAGECRTRDCAHLALRREAARLAQASGRDYLDALDELRRADWLTEHGSELLR